MIRIFDLFFSFLGLLILSPILIIIFIIGWLDNGSPLFTQERVGRYQRSFILLKLRSMPINTLSVATHLARNTNISPFGQFLRKTKLDEIPQLFNIILGQMSFIGPRPTLVSHWNRYTKEQKRRSKMLPGITGWAQVCGRNEIPWSKRIELDIEYINNFSLWLDVVIALKTIYVIFRRKDISMDRNTSSVDDLDGDKNEK